MVCDGSGFFFEAFSPLPSGFASDLLEVAACCAVDVSAAGAAVAGASALGAS